MKISKEKLLSNLIQEAREHFLESEPNSTSLSFFKKTIAGKLYTVIGIEKDHQTKALIQSTKTSVLKAIGFAEDSGVIQVIGDSANFQADKINLARNFLFNLLNQYPQHLILYGFTGHADEKADLYDANGFVSAWINKDLSNRCQRVLGNVVDLHTLTAINQWHCDVGDIQNIFLVYTRGEPQAKFGDDVISSDYFVKNSVSQAKDKQSFCVLLEGGIQAFNQVVRMLEEDVKVYAIQGIRGNQNPACLDKETNIYIPYFSAAEFFGMIKAAAVKNPELTKDEVKTLLSEYIYDPKKDGVYDPTSNKRVYANPNRADYDTKAALMENAINAFIEKELWKKLSLLEMTDASAVKNVSKFLTDNATTKKFSSLYKLPQNITKSKTVEENTHLSQPKY